MRVNNVTDVEHCARCDDTGWVELLGTVKPGGPHGAEYSRGMAPCKWCDLGTKRFLRATERSDGQRWHPESDFDEADIEPEPQHGARFTPDADFLRQREAAGCKREALQAMFPRRIWPSEWPTRGAESLVKAMPREDATIEQKRKQADTELNRFQSQKPASPEPSSDHEEPPQVPQDAEIVPEYDPDEVPF